MLPQHYGALEDRIRRELAAAPPGRALSVEATRLVQMFEDPPSLADVRTLHGLKRYLHQRGLALGFGLLESEPRHEPHGRPRARVQPTASCATVRRSSTWTSSPDDADRNATCRQSRTPCRRRRRRLRPAPAARAHIAAAGPCLLLRQRGALLRLVQEPPGVHPHRLLAAAQRRDDRPRLLRRQQVRTRPPPGVGLDGHPGRASAAATSTSRSTTRASTPATTRSAPSTSPTSARRRKRCSASCRT